MRRTVSSAALLIGVSTLAMAPVHAQTPAPAAAPTAVETVTVTATRRERALQAVPIAITALGEAQIRRAGITDIQTLTQLVPSLQVPMTENASSVTARIRGVGTQGSNPGLESAVGVFVDGVYRPRNGLALTDLGEIARVEVLRGPQGTLFGRNTSAGLINISTAAPAFAFEAEAEATYGTFDARSLSGAITGPLSETIAGRLFVKRHLREGFATVNPGSGAGWDYDDRDLFTARGQLLFRLGADADLRVIADITSREEECCYAGVLRPARDPDGAGAGIAADAAINTLLGFTGIATRPTIESQESFANRRYPQEVDDHGLSAELTWSTPFGEFTSVTAWRDWSFANGQDNDYSRADILYRPFDGGNFIGIESFTQELRLNGTAGALDWLVGLYVSDETITRGDNQKTGADHEGFLSLHRFGAPGAQLAALAAAQATMAGNPLGPWGPVVAPAPAAITTAGGGVDDRYRQEAQSFALFSHNVIALSGAASLTLGLRWTKEWKDFQATYRTSGAPGCAFLEGELGFDPAAVAAANGIPAALVGFTCLPWQRRALDVLTATTAQVQRREEDEFSGLLTYAYTFSERINAYGTYARGYKAGGFNLDRTFGDLRGPNGSNLSIVSGPVGAQAIRGPDTSFAPETADSIEIGLKTTHDGGRLLVNGALFWQRFENFQLNTFNGLAFLVTSVPEVLAKGVEVDAAWQLASGLNLTAGLAYTDARYGDDLGSVTPARTSGTLIDNAPNLRFLPGARLTSSPAWALSGSIAQSFALGSGWELRASADARWISETVTGSNLDPEKNQPAFTLVNARIEIAVPDSPFTLVLWGRNLLDERYHQIAFDSPIQGSAPTLGAPIPGPVLGATPTTGTSQLNAFFAEPLTAGITLRAAW